MYFLNELEGEDLIDSLTGSNSTSKVKKFFKQVHRQDLDHYLNENDIDASAHDVLRDFFGYGAILNSDVDEQEYLPEGEEELPENLEESAENSIQIIESRLETIAQLFFQFYEPYNAVKHGNRVIYGGITNMELDSTAIDDDTSSELITILCRKSGEYIENPDPYLVDIPPKFLAKLSESRAHYTKNLFEQLRSVSKARNEHEQKYTVKFYEGTNSESDENYVKITNKDATIFLPKTEAFEEYLQGETKISTRAELKVNNDRLVFETGKNKPMEVVIPIEIEAENPQAGAMRADMNMSFNIGDMNVSEYLNFLKSKDALENNKIDWIQFRDDNGNVLNEERLEGGFNLPDNFPVYEERKDLEFLVGLQKATGEEVPPPLEINEKHKKIIEEHIGESLSRDEASNVVSELEAAPKTQNTVMYLKKEGSKDLLNHIRGLLTMKMDLDGGGTRELTEILAEEGQSARIKYAFMPGDFQEFVESVENNIENFIGMLEERSELAEKPEDYFHMAVSFEFIRDNIWGRDLQVDIERLDSEENL